MTTARQMREVSDRVLERRVEEDKREEKKRREEKDRKNAELRKLLEPEVESSYRGALAKIREAANRGERSCELRWSCGLYAGTPEVNAVCAVMVAERLRKDGFVATVKQQCGSDEGGVEIVQNASDCEIVLSITF
ncbi:MAG: hypothetical protein HYW89_02730 [Candidatus Sungiibacteriota bacterium]|uniref:Uncharacterized protein n=1 Tax=Candidatus Sungiibacteriota bacterium TaxID=2750080 RepID=A0A7T5UQB4_9BACT|nr:MAG: hypothetical protein HYW89_02730 [Candidatus Sungbacteria bacterium]